MENYCESFSGTSAFFIPSNMKEKLKFFNHLVRRISEEVAPAADPNRVVPEHRRRSTGLKRTQSLPDLALKTGDGQYPLFPPQGRFNDVTSPESPPRHRRPCTVCDQVDCKQKKLYRSYRVNYSGLADYWLMFMFNTAPCTDHYWRELEKFCAEETIYRLICTPCEEDNDTRNLCLNVYHTRPKLAILVCRCRGRHVIPCDQERPAVYSYELYHVALEDLPNYIARMIGLKDEESRARAQARRDRPEPSRRFLERVQRALARKRYQSAIDLARAFT